MEHVQSHTVSIPSQNACVYIIYIYIYIVGPKKKMSYGGQGLRNALWSKRSELLENGSIPLMDCPRFHSSSGPIFAHHSMVQNCHVEEPSALRLFAVDFCTIRKQGLHGLCVSALSGDEQRSPAIIGAGTVLTIASRPEFSSGSLKASASAETVVLGCSKGSFPTILFSLVKGVRSTHRRCVRPFFGPLKR